MFERLQGYIQDSSVKKRRDMNVGRANTLFINFQAYCYKIMDPKLSTYLEEFKNAEKILNSGRLDSKDKQQYITLLQNAEQNIKATYEIMYEAFRAFELRSGNDADRKDLKYVNSIIDKAKITKKNALLALDEIKKINKKYGL